MGPSSYNYLNINDEKNGIEGQLLNAIIAIKKDKGKGKDILSEILSLYYNDLENVKLSKEEFVNTIIINKIFSILSDFVVEEKIDDKDFENTVNILMSTLVRYNSLEGKEDGTEEEKSEGFKALEKLIKGEKGEEIKKILRKNNYFITSPSFLSSKYVEIVKKERILSFLILLLKEKVIVKGEEGESVITKNILIARDIEKESEENSELENAGDAASIFLKTVKRNGWKEEVEEAKCDIEELKKEIERLKIEKEKAEKKREEVVRRERAEHERAEKEKKEKEELIEKAERLKKEKEEALKLKEEIKMEKEKIIKEKEEMKKELYAEKSKNSLLENQIINHI